jgi:peptidoglycan hydrolase CwlO-like protein
MVLQTWAVVCAGLLILATGCKPDDSPFRTENETLRKQLAKQESVVTSLQDGNKVMQQQIDLLNQELRDAKKAVDSTKAEARAALDSMEAQLNQAKRLTVEAQKTAAAQAAQSIHVDGKGAQADDIPRPLATVA